MIDQAGPGTSSLQCAEAYVVSVVQGRRGLIPGIIRGGLALLALLYAAGLECYLFLYRIGVRKATRLRCPVICIGNLTTGGTGKTPTTQMICRMLAAQGKRVAVIIRGYRSEYEQGSALVSDGETLFLSAREAGDEAFLLARSLPDVPVAVGRDRIRTGRLVYERCKPDIIVMDDGMQHWRLHRDLDIVLLNSCNPFDNGWTVPRGMLREPKSHIRRAGIILLTNARRAGDARIEAIREELAGLAPECPVFAGDLAPIGIQDLYGHQAADLKWLKGRRVGAMCALGNPASFEAMLVEQGAIVAPRLRFRDHHTIADEELARAREQARISGAEAIITTEKDAVKLSYQVAAPPVLVFHVVMKVNEEAAFLSAVAEGLNRNSNRDSQPSV